MTCYEYAIAQVAKEFTKKIEHGRLPIEERPTAALCIARALGYAMPNELEHREVRRLERALTVVEALNGHNS